MITFDDGWHDFHENAFPILKTNNIFATVFLPTDLIGTKAWFWPDRLGYLLAKRHTQRKSVQCSSDSKRIINQIEALEGCLERKTETAINMLKKYRHEEIEQTISELSKRWKIGQNIPGRPFLSWQEVREMRNSGLISFGSHTASHRILTTLTESEILYELTRSKKKLISEGAVDRTFIPFCYPNGNHDEKIAAMVRSAGYHLAVTTQSGPNRSGDDLFTLHRTGIHQDMASTPALFACRIAGIF